MASDQAAAARLARFLDWRTEPAPQLTWEQVEGRLATDVPSGIKELSRHFPTGSFGGWIHFYNPVQSERSLEMFLGTAKSKSETFRHARQIDHSCFPHPFHPEEGGLVAWGHGDQHTYFWSSLPSTKGVLYCDNHGDGWGHHPGTAPEFLLALFKDELETEVLYDQWAGCRFFSQFPDYGS
ncbi:hypothetical protein ACGFMK_25510 [Amycolatopsis sp. NPDC049252]|uniref:hypothetical protein n=1 Tax=Amycolatopsis sp. NPDC049252 TaxID=3363933 RepID=UPI003714447A